MIGGVATVGGPTTTEAFTASQTGAAVTVTGGTGSSATATVDTDADGDVTAVNITAGGTGYTDGDTLTLTEVGGTPGVATVTVTSVS